MIRRRSDSGASSRRPQSSNLRPISFVVTCEHGGNHIPRRYEPIFRGRRRLLESHRGWDPGALEMARSLSGSFDAALVTATVSRLLVELNRSPRHRAFYSRVMRAAPEGVRQEVYRRYYVPYRTKVENAVRGLVMSGARVIHISSHSFTPRLRGVVRKADIGLLYDPRRRSERTLCAHWQAALRAREPRWIVRRNYPYKGANDGLTQYLRGRFPDELYCGIELEINHKHVFGDDGTWSAMRAEVIEALRSAVVRQTPIVSTRGHVARRPRSGARARRRSPC